MKAAKGIADDATLCRRALVAYLRTGGAAEPMTPRCEPVKHDGLLYVVLSSAYRTLAVYRVHNDGALRRMKRWPREVAPRNTGGRDEPKPAADHPAAS